MGYASSVIVWRVIGGTDHKFSSLSRDKIVGSSMNNKLLLFVGSVAEHRKENLEMIDAFIVNML